MEVLEKDVLGLREDGIIAVGDLEGLILSLEERVILQRDTDYVGVLQLQCGWYHILLMLRSVLGFWIPLPLSNFSTILLFLIIITLILILFFVIILFRG